MRQWNWKQVFLFVGGTALIGFASNFLSGNTHMVYEMLNKPPLSPPVWLFRLVWPVLYILIGFAAARVYASSTNRYWRRRGLVLYGGQLVASFLWPIAFFTFGFYWLAALVLAVLIIMVVMASSAFKWVDELSGKLMTPYIVWLIYALYLNVGVAIMN